MLSAVGVPPDASALLMAMIQQTKYYAGFILLAWLFCYQRKMHMRLSAGEQVRRHYRSGGYLP